MRLIVYTVIFTCVDDILNEDIDNIFPTEESAVVHAKKLAASPNIYDVRVSKDEVTEEYGRAQLTTVYTEEHHERYEQRYL